MDLCEFRASLVYLESQDSQGYTVPAPWWQRAGGQKLSHGELDTSLVVHIFNWEAEAGGGSQRFNLKKQFCLQHGRHREIKLVFIGPVQTGSKSSWEMGQDEER